MTQQPIISPAEFANGIRRIILQQSKRANVGHIGSALSVADIVAALYSKILSVDDPQSPERDRFILSKGHAALALYAALNLRGWISDDHLNTFVGDGTTLGVHPEHVVPGIDFCSGSLGQGLSIGAGCALAARMQGSPRHTFVLVSDAECNEGSTWEAVMFAAHRQLANLVVFVDLNRQQALGYTREVLDLGPMADRWTAFGWDTVEVDGNDPNAIVAAVASLNTTSGYPHVVIANTVFGCGVSFMESQIKWHYLPMSDADYERAMTELGGRG
jgi:transketolase